MPDQSLEAKRTMQTVELARRAFENHVVIERTESNWLIKRFHADGRPESTYWTEIAVLRKNLYVGGDIYPVLFEGGPGHPIARIRWMGETNDLTYYVAQKASMGMRCESSVWNWNAEIAYDDLRHYMQERRGEDEEAPEPDEHYLSCARRAETQRDFIENAGQAFARHSKSLGGRVVDHEPFYRMGEILDARVIYAHAALQRLCALIRQEEAAGPLEVANG